MLTGAGGTFTAGGDIAGFLERVAEEVSRLACERRRARALPEARDRAVDGYVFGVGFELALACDFRIAADDAQLGLPEIGARDDPRLGRHAAAGAAGRARPREGRRSCGAGGSGRGRARLGLVSEVVPAAELDAAVGRVVAELVALSPLALAMAKRVLNQVYDGPLQLGPRARGPRLRGAQLTHDFREGVEAFVEKRPPEFQGR